MFKKGNHHSVEYILQRKNESANNIVAAVELRALTEVLGNAYEKLKQLGLRASMRKAQLVLFNLSSEVYKYYLEAVIQVQVLEKRLFYPFKIENYPDEWYVVNFNRELKKDNTEEIFDECLEVKHEIQRTYNHLISNSSVSIEQKKTLQQQLNGLVNCFLKLKIKCTA